MGQSPSYERRIVIGTAPRTGSNWIFGCVRLLTEAAGKQYTIRRGKRVRFRSGPDPTVLLIKSHKPIHFGPAAFVITAIRHPLDMLASMAALHKASGKLPRPGLVTDYIKWANHWLKQAKLVIRFEELMADKRGHVELLAGVLYPDTEADFDVLAEELEEIPKRANARSEPNALFGRHRTGVDAGGWQSILSHELAKQICQKHAGWLAQHDYANPFA